ncbi:MAG: ribonuclease HII, partial [bacterium]|nr:ribonuclease HII [bacterium]
MRYSTLEEERRLWKNGYRLVAGIDEVGRGPLAGPVVACAVAMINSKFEYRNQKQYQNLNVQNLKLRDSKQLSAKQREELYKILINHRALEWGKARVYPSVIDRINIFHATKLAMKRALENLQKKLQNRAVDFVILDGNMTLDISIPQKAIVKADEKVLICAAASIIAKVKRDRLMNRYHKKYALYGFDKHKGYGTKLHIATLKKHGLCDIHR